MAESTGAAPDAVRRLDSSEATELAALAGVFDDLQYALRCCEHLVGALARPAVDNGGGDAALVEALWTGALVAYARCFSGRTKIMVPFNAPLRSSLNRFGNARRGGAYSLRAAVLPR